MKDYPSSAFKTVQMVSTCTESKLLQTTFYHLGKKFGRSTSPYPLAGFLLNSIGSSLRYCSSCLAETPYYLLTWRFIGLKGCYKHSCRFFDVCGHCGKTIPFLASPLHIGFCPTCNGDLRQCLAEPLTEEEYLEVLYFSQNIEFLLIPQIWEEAYGSIASNLGREYALLRRTKGLTASEVKRRIGVPLSSSKLADIEFGRSQGATFQQYVKYSELLGVSLLDIFHLMLQRHVDDTKLKLLRREFLPSEKILLGLVQEAVDTLRSLDEEVTQGSISKSLRISVGSLRKYSQVRTFLEQLSDEAHKRQKRNRESEMLERVQMALKQLENWRKPVTYPTFRSLIDSFCENW